MEESLVTPEVKKKITYLLGKRSSFVFICFARVLYASKNHTWIDDNLMGYFTVTITRGLVKGYPLYSALLFDYDSFDLKLCFEFPDNMERAIKCGNCCYIIPHQNLSFCLLFPDLDDALTFEMGMNGVHGTMQRNSFPQPVAEPTDVKKKKRGLFSLFRKNKEESKDVSVSGVMEIHKEDGACFSMLDRLSLQSDMARFHLFPGTQADVFSDARLAERRVLAESLWSEVELPPCESTEVAVRPSAEERQVEAQLTAAPFEEATASEEPVDLDEKTLCLLNESVEEAMLSPELSLATSPPVASSKQPAETSVPQAERPGTLPVSAEEVAAREETSLSGKDSEERVAAPSLSNPSATSPAEESVSSPANPPANPTQATPGVAESFSLAASREMSPERVDSESLEFADLTASMLDSIPLAPILSSSTVESSIMRSSAVESCFPLHPAMESCSGQSSGPSVGQSVDQSSNQPVNQSSSQSIVESIDQPVNQPVNQPINQPTNPPTNPPIITNDTKPSVSRRRRRTLQPAIAVEAKAASMRASVESVSSLPHAEPSPQPEPTANPPSDVDLAISVETSDLLRDIDAIQPTHTETNRPSVLSSLSTDSVNEAALEKAMETVMESIDSAPHLQKPTEPSSVSPVRVNPQPSEIRRVSIGVPSTPIQLIRRSGSTRPSDQPSIQPSSSTAIKHVTSRRVSLQPTPPPPRNVPPPPPMGVRRTRPSLVRPSKEMASSRTSSEHELRGRTDASLDDPLKNVDDGVVFDIPTLSTHANM